MEFAHEDLACECSHFSYQITVIKFSHETPCFGFCLEEIIVRPISNSNLVSETIKREHFSQIECLRLGVTCHCDDNQKWLLWPSRYLVVTKLNRVLFCSLWFHFDKFVTVHQFHFDHFSERKSQPSLYSILISSLIVTKSWSSASVLKCESASIRSVFAWMFEAITTGCHIDK